MSATASARILDLARQQRFLRAADVRSLGASPQLLVKLYQAGRLSRTARGIYSLPEVEPVSHDVLAEVCQRVPRAIVCLLSALQFHDIGSQLPHDVWIALPEGARTPGIEYPAIRVVRMRGQAYGTSVETHAADGASVRVYSVAKTITDCFKFRNKIGLDVALEALKDSWRRRRVSMDELTRHARINRVERVMQPYLEAMVA